MMKRWAILAGFVWLFVASSLGSAQQALTIEEYRDTEYGYAFQYPAGWELRKLPEGSGNQLVQVLLRTPNGNSFMVVVEKRERNPSKAEFEADPKRRARVDGLMAQTERQIYATVARNLGAVESKRGETEDLTNDAGIKFYVSTLHKVKSGDRVVVAGVHCYPFARTHAVSFLMTAFFDPAAKQDNAMMRAVFNSFHLLD